MQAMIWILRHAAAGPTTDAKDDDKRPLTKEGQIAARAAGIALKKLGTPIQGCIASPLHRAKETAELACEALGLEVHIEEKLSGYPLTRKDVKMLAKPYGNVLLVGHAPAVNLVVYEFTGCQCQLAKGGLAQIHEGEVWSLLNPSTCLVMSGLDKELPFDDPQEVDTRSEDDHREHERSDGHRPIENRLVPIGSGKLGPKPWEL